MLTVTTNVGARIRSLVQDIWSKPELRWLAVILVLATVLRVIWVLYVAREPQGAHDPIFYLAYGDALSEGRRYALPGTPPENPVILGGPTAYYPIGYSAALAAVFALVKYTPIPENLVLANGFFQVFLGVATIALVYEVARRLFSIPVALVASLWLALFPNLIYHTANFLTETLFNFLVMAAILVLVGVSWHQKRLGWARLTIFAILIGLAALVRPISLLFLPILPVVWLAFGFGWRRSLAYAAVVFGVAAAVLTPWAIRNVVVMDAPVVISTNFGDNLCIGHHEGAFGGFDVPETCFQLAEYAGLERPDFEVQRNSDNTRKALTFARNNIVEELKLLSRKAYYTWWRDHDGLFAAESYGDDLFFSPNVRRGLGRLADIYFYITISIGGLGLVGLILSPRDGRRIFFLLALLAFAGVPLVFFGDSRFHVPVMPFLVVAAAWAAVSLRHVPAFLARLERREEAGDGTSAVVKVTHGEGAVAEQDALHDAEPDEERD